MLDKLFLWMGLKEKLYIGEPDPPYFKEGERWWVYFGENIGAEINGKGELFTRPAVIYKKLNKKTLLVIPITTKIKQGSWFVSISYKRKEEVAILSQIRVISYKRLQHKVGKLGSLEMEMIRNNFRNLYF